MWFCRLPGRLQAQCSSCVASSPSFLPLPFPSRARPSAVSKCKHVTSQLSPPMGGQRSACAPQEDIDENVDEHGSDTSSDEMQVVWQPGLHGWGAAIAPHLVHAASLIGRVSAVGFPSSRPLFCEWWDDSWLFITCHPNFTRVHPSHCIARYRTVLVCIVCGAWCQHRMAGLTRVCPGVRSNSGRHALIRLRAGMFPSTFDQDPRFFADEV